MRYRKRPVVIDAWPWNPSDPRPVLNALEAAGAGYTYMDGEGWLRIRTLEGEITASPGDWVVRGVQGEFYPIKPDIFAATYDPAGEDEAQEIVR